MPYISPALSPVKTFNSNGYGSASSSTSSSPVSSTRVSPSNSSIGLSSKNNVSSTRTSDDATASNTSANAGVQFSASYANGFPRRPLQRHHSRSHSSDALVTSASLSSSSSSRQSSSSNYAFPSKATPEYIYVHPASPGQTHHQHERQSSTPSSSTTSVYSASSSYSSLGSSSSSSSAYHSRPALRSLSSSRSSVLSNGSNGSTSTIMSAGDSGDVAPPRTARSRNKKFHLGSSSNSNGGNSGSTSADNSPRGSIIALEAQAYTLPLPNLDTMSPPAFANRSSSSPALLGMAEESSRQLGHPSSSSLPVLQEDTPLSMEYNQRQEQEREREQPEQGEYMLRSTDLSADDSALMTSSETSSGSGSASGSDTESFDANGGEASQVKSIRIPRRPLMNAKPSWGDLPTPTMGSSTSFSFANGNGEANLTPTGISPADSPVDHMGNSVYPNGDSYEMMDTTAVPTPKAEAPSSSSSSSAAVPTSGALAPSSFRVKRPTHIKSYSERVDSPMSIEFESTHRARQAEFGSHHPLVHQGHPSASQIAASYSGRHQRSHSHRPPPLPTPMLRKKSGELVKSSMKHDSRARSAPTTPTGPKAVHFDEQLERVKLFLAQQKPTAVSRDGSPIETETEDDSEAAFPFPPMTTSIPAQISLVMPDFPKNILPELGDRAVCMETLEIAADWKSLKGTCLLRNIAFEKRLSIRFTLDDWQTVSEVTGEWASTLVGSTIDRWTFTIKLQDMLARIEDRKMFIAIRYQVNGEEIWDNNYGKNYLAEFRKQAARSQAVVGGARAARHEWAVTNPGQASERMADLRRELDRLVADQDDYALGADELILSPTSTAVAGGAGGPASALSPNAQHITLRYQPRYLGGEALPLAQAPASTTFSSRYDFGASLKNEKAARITNSSNPANYNSPQSAHAILDNPYFASHAPTEAMVSSWRNNNAAAASIMSPAPSSQTSSLHSSPPQPPQPTLPNLYADDRHIATSIIGGMPTAMLGEPSATTPPASFTGSNYYPRTEANGVVSTDFGLPNYMSMHSVASGSPLTAVSPLPDLVHFDSPALGVVGGEFVGGAALSRQARFNSFPPGKSGLRSPNARASAQETLASLEPSLDDQDPLDTSNYSPAMSPAQLSPPRQASPPPRPLSPEDLLSPSPSSASTDTSISTPQSPNGSPPLKMYAPYLGDGGGRPDMGSDTYFNFVHRYCWGNSDGSTTSSSASTSSTSTALGLAGLNSLDSATPRRSTPPSSCSASLLSSPTASTSGSRTPSPRNGSPSLENVARMEQNGYMYGPPTVEI